MLWITIPNRCQGEVGNHSLTLSRIGSPARSAQQRLTRPSAAAAEHPYSKSTSILLNVSLIAPPLIVARHRTG